MCGSNFNREPTDASGGGFQTVVSKKGGARKKEVQNGRVPVAKPVHLPPGMPVPNDPAKKKRKRRVCAVISTDEGNILLIKY